jgi:hypothetical protein
MATLHLCDEADEEIDALYQEHHAAAEALDALLIELEEHEDLLETLYRPNFHFNAAPPFEIKRYEEMQKRGYNIFTVKVQLADGSWPPYRALIGFHGQANTYHVLAIAPRDIAYERSDPLFAAVIDRYERAGIPVYR